ncbi:hypothetical protein HDU92_008492, partial [Lobulomyces angularis]
MSSSTYSNIIADTLEMTGLITYKELSRIANCSVNDSKLALKLYSQNNKKIKTTYFKKLENKLIISSIPGDHIYSLHLKNPDSDLIFQRDLLISTEDIDPSNFRVIKSTVSLRNSKVLPVEQPSLLNNLKKNLNPINSSSNSTTTKDEKSLHQNKKPLERPSTTKISNTKSKNESSSKSLKQQQQSMSSFFTDFQNKKKEIKPYVVKEESEQEEEEEEEKTEKIEIEKKKEKIEIEKKNFNNDIEKINIDVSKKNKKIIQTVNIAKKKLSNEQKLEELEGKKELENLFSSDNEKNDKMECENVMDVKNTETNTEITLPAASKRVKRKRK